MSRIILVMILSGLMSFSYPSTKMIGPGHFYGAWEMKKDNITYTKIFTSGFFIYSAYDLEGKEFIEAGGGTWSMTTKGVSEVYEFQTSNPELVGTTLNYSFDGDHERQPLRMTVTKNGEEIQESWIKIDEESSPLFGAWRITQRERNGQMTPMQQGSRKTMKVLSGTRFQWAAFNVETKQFMGTGGGTYNAENGQYTENIEFFSRDNSRVGASLEFNFRVDDKDWHHMGFSSKGDPIYEIWTKQD